MFSPPSKSYLHKSVDYSPLADEQAMLLFRSAITEKWQLEAGVLKGKATLL